MNKVRWCHEVDVNSLPMLYTLGKMGFIDNLWIPELNVKVFYSWVVVQFLVDEEMYDHLCKRMNYQ